MKTKTNVPVVFGSRRFTYDSQAITDMTHRVDIGVGITLENNGHSRRDECIRILQDAIVGLKKGEL